MNGTAHNMNAKETTTNSAGHPDANLSVFAPRAPPMQLLDSLSNNDLTLVVTSPALTAAASSEGRRRDGGGGTTSLAPKQTVDALTALLLAEEGLKAQHAVTAGVEEERVSPRSRRRGGKRTTPVSSSRPVVPSSVVERRRRIELGAQLALARALVRSPCGARHRQGLSPSLVSSFCSSFAVRLDPRPAPPKRSSREDKGGGGASREEEEDEGGCCGGSSSGDGGNGEAGGGGGRQRGGGGGGGEIRSRCDGFAVDDCELCILRDGVPYRLLCSV